MVHAADGLACQPHGHGEWTLYTDKRQLRQSMTYFRLAYIWLTRTTFVFIFVLLVD